MRACRVVLSVTAVATRIFPNKRDFYEVSAAQLAQNSAQHVTPFLRLTLVFNVRRLFSLCD